MKNIVFIIGFLFVSCSKNAQVYTPVGGMSNEEMGISKNRAKQLNTMEREQIQEWISKQKEKFYPTQLNYWSNIENLEQRKKKQDGELVSFQYELYDFDLQKFYEKPKTYKDAPLGKFEELDAIEDVVRYLNPDEEVTLLVPSVLAYGTYGDGDQIPYDMPLIIKLKLIK
jgi:peptidyl-prolyl cis-trans isomerase